MLQNSNANPLAGALNTGMRKCFLFSTEIAVYLVKGTIYVHGYYGSIGTPR